MEQAKREQLEAMGWKVGTVAEFLELTPEEKALVEIKPAQHLDLAEATSKSDEANGTCREC